MNKHRYIIGIDCGVKNGFAVYDSKERCIIELTTYKMYEVLFKLQSMIGKEDSVHVRIENPNTWIDYKHLSVKAVSARKQGAGSVKRSYQVIEEFLIDKGVSFDAVSLRSCMKKVNAETFQRVTGIKQRTNEHERDACMLVWK